MEKSTAAQKGGRENAVLRQVQRGHGLIPVQRVCGGVIGPEHIGGLVRAENVLPLVFRNGHLRSQLRIALLVVPQIGQVIAVEYKHHRLLTI